MTKFTFSLEVLLTHRLKLESDAQKVLAQKQAEIVAVNTEIGRLQQERSDLLETPRKTIAEYKELEAAVIRIDDTEREHRIIRSVLSDEAAVFRSKWVVAKQDLEVVAKLREKALELWRVEAERFEQRELDEWATQRRAA